MNSPNPSQNYRTRRRPPLAQNSTWAGSPGWDPAGVRGRRPASGAASGRVRPRSGIRVWQTSNISLGSGMVRRGVRLPSGRIRRGLGTRVLLTCPGPADPRYWGGSCSCHAHVTTPPTVISSREAERSQREAAVEPRLQVRGLPCARLDSPHI